MTANLNHLGQPIGFPMDTWQISSHPQGSTMQGRFCRLEPLDKAHARDLFEAFSADSHHRNWTYLPYGPFENLDDLEAWLQLACEGDDPCFFTAFDLATDKAVGIASYLRITPETGTIEVGHIHFSPKMQRTPISTEAMFLMMAHIFEVLGYRRYEWKCDALNQPSRQAAQRLGFMFEGIFRQATIYKNRNRDTAWYSIIDSEWPPIKAAFESWLSDANFDSKRNQKSSLSSAMSETLKAIRTPIK